MARNPSELKGYPRSPPYLSGSEGDGGLAIARHGPKSLRHYTSYFSRIYEVIPLNLKGLDVTKVVIVASNEINLTDLVQRPIALCPKTVTQEGF